MHHIQHINTTYEQNAPAVYVTAGPRQDGKFVVTHTLRQTEAPRFTRQYGYKHTFCQNVVSTTNCSSLYFCINVTCLSAGQMRIGPVPGVSGTTVYRWAMAHCGAMSEVLHVVTVVYRWATAHCGAMSEVIHVVTVVYRWATAQCCAMSEVLHIVTVVYWWATAHCCAMSEVIHVVTVVYRLATAHCCAMSEVIHVVTVVYRWVTAHCSAMSEVIHVVTTVYWWATADCCTDGSSSSRIP